MRLLTLFYVSVIATPISVAEMQVILGKAHFSQSSAGCHRVIAKSDGHLSDA